MNDVISAIRKSHSGKSIDEDFLQSLKKWAFDIMAGTHTGIDYTPSAKKHNNGTPDPAELGNANKYCKNAARTQETVAQ